MEGAIQQAQELHQQRQEAGFDQLALDSAAKAGLANGLFEESEEEFSEVKEEFFNSSLLGPNLLQDSAPAGLSKVRRAALRSSTP